MTDKEIRMELAVAALKGGLNVGMAKEAYEWVTNVQRVYAANLDEIPVADMEDAMGKHAVRFRNRCRDNDIVTVGQLVRLGSNGFRGLRLVGGGMVSFIQDALMKKYGIEKW